RVPAAGWEGGHGPAGVGGGPSAGAGSPRRRPRPAARTAAAHPSIARAPGPSKGVGGQPGALAGVQLAPPAPPAARRARAARERAELGGRRTHRRGDGAGGRAAGPGFRPFARSPGAPAEPDRPRFKGPMALLLDERCISAGEGWASWFIARKRARVFGTTSA